MKPPSEIPAILTASSPRCSIKAIVSVAIISTVYGPTGQPDGAIPRLSKLITWYPARTGSSIIPNRAQESAL